MGTMDASIVTISFPALTRVFDTTPSVVVWVALAYQLTVTGTLLTIGRTADILGRKKVFVTGLVVFTLGLVLCPLSQGILQLIGFRVVQALGAAMTVALGNAILAASFPQEERGRALGLLEAVVGIGLMSGPALGGILLDTLGWQAIFYLRIPLGIGACIMALLVLREQPRDGPRDRMDLLGSTTLFLGLSSLILAVNQGQGQGWTSPMVIGLGIVAVLSLGLFFSIELRAAQPVIDLNLFRVRRFAVTNALLLTSSLAAIAVPFVLPFYLIEALGLSASRSGLVIMTVPLMLFLLSPVSGALSDRFGARLLITAGLAIQSLGYFLLSTRGADSAVLSVWPLLTLVGLGGGLFSTPNVSALMSAAPARAHGLSLGAHAHRAQRWARSGPGHDRRRLRLGAVRLPGECVDRHGGARPRGLRHSRRIPGHLHRRGGSSPWPHWRYRCSSVPADRPAAPSAAALHPAAPSAQAGRRHCPLPRSLDDRPSRCNTWGSPPCPLKAFCAHRPPHPHVPQVPGQRPGARHPTPSREAGWIGRGLSDGA